MIVVDPDLGHVSGSALYSCPLTAPRPCSHRIASPTVGVTSHNIGLSVDIGVAVGDRCNGGVWKEIC